MKKLFAKLSMFIFPFLLLSIALPILFTIDPMRFMDDEYAWYRQNSDYSADHDDYCRVLIMGDSLAKAGYTPELLSDDSYNFALGGASPIEEYYCLNEYLQNNPAPEYVIYTQSIKHFMVAECFWSRGVYFHRLSIDETLEAYSSQKMINDDILEGDDALGCLLYYSYSPLRYASAFIKSCFTDRQTINADNYAYAVENMGRFYLPKADSIGVGQVAEFTGFRCSGLINTYLKTLIELCHEYGIKFIYQSAPLTSITYKELNEEFVEEYEEYIDELRSDYPEDIFNAALFSYDDLALFIDDSHLSNAGAMKFSIEMREKYADVFMGKHTNGK